MLSLKNSKKVELEAKRVYIYFWSHLDALAEIAKVGIWDKKGLYLLAVTP